MNPYIHTFQQEYLLAKVQTNKVALRLAKHFVTNDLHNRLQRILQPVLPAHLDIQP
jgi:hypothetical protein